FAIAILAAYCSANELFPLLAPPVMKINDCFSMQTTPPTATRSLLFDESETASSDHLTLGNELYAEARVDIAVNVDITRVDQSVRGHVNQTSELDCTS